MRAGQCGYRLRWLRVAVALAFVVPALLLPLRARAQNRPPENAIPHLEPVVVTGAKTPTPAPTLGGSITVIDDDEIRTRQATEMTDVLSTVPGLRVEELGGHGGLTVVSPRGGTGHTFNQVLIDGVKVNNAGGVMNFAGLSLVNFERVEVLRGPQSGLYGPDAAGSVIHFITVRGRGPLQTSVSVGAGNHDTFEKTVTLAVGSGPFGLSLGGHRIDTDGHLPHSDFRSTTLSARGDVGRSDELELTLAGRYVESHVQLPVVVGGDRFVPLDPHQFVDQRRVYVSVRGAHALSARWKQTLQLGFVQHGAAIIDRLDPGLDVAEVRSEVRERRYSADYFWTLTAPKILDVATTFTAGAAYEKETVRQHLAVSGPLPSRRDVDADREVASGYLALQLGWRDRAFLSAGVRVDDSTVFGTEVTPRGAVAAILPVTRTRVRAAYGEGIRAPSFFQIFGEGLGFVNGNPNLLPERVRSWEAGLDQPIAGRVAEVAVTYFRTQFDDLIALVPGGTPGSFNVGRAEASGVELSVKVHPSSWMTVTGAYTWLRTETLENGGIAEVESPIGAPLLRQPEHWGSLVVDVTWGRVRGSITGLVVGSAEDFNVVASPFRRVQLEPYARIDAAISYQVVRQRGSLDAVEVFGRARNLTDTSYENVHGFSAPGVSFVVGLRATF